MDEKDKIKILLEGDRSYNNHKENMAYAGVLLQIGLFASIITMEQWPPCWINVIPQWLLFTLLLIVWLLIHLFIGWQLMNRDLAARRTGASIRYLLKSPGGKPKKNNEQPSNDSWWKKLRKKRRGKLWKMLCWFLKSDYKGDVEITGLDCWHDFFDAQETKALTENRILFFGSIFMFLMILYRTFG